ncbi:hypothetical protein [Streptacidiphilus monticola]|uniref:Uncharacterized protein n=1 Tax=Streptacidiphilus monticola TaxID=2161674 RepID=A0ABW1G416_9ACTN
MTTAPEHHPTPQDLAALLDRAERDIAAQRHAYGTELDDDTAARAAWNTWRTLRELVPAIRALLDSQPTPTGPAAAVRHLRVVREAA